MKAIILAGGFGTRLSKVTSTPKPLIKINNTTIIDSIINKVIKYVDDIIVVSNNKHYNHYNKWLINHNFKSKIKLLNNGVSNNSERLGSLGDLRFALRDVNDDIFVIAGDNFFDFSLDDFFNFSFSKNTPVIGVYDVKDIEKAKSLGIVALDVNQKVIKFVEKPSEPPSTLASTAIYYFPRDSLNLISKYLDLGLPSDRLGDFIAWLYKQITIYGFTFKGKWYDVGTVDSYINIVLGDSMKITIIGTGYVGLITGVGLAHLGNNVLCYDINEEKVNRLKSGDPVIYEEGLEEKLKFNLEKKRINFTSNAKEAINFGDVIFIAVGTPQSDSGEADLTYIKDAAKTIARYMDRDKVVVTKSTVPVGTNKMIEEIINSNKENDFLVHIVSCPEFLREGTAIKDFFNPDRVVIGSESEFGRKTVYNLFKPLERSFRPIVLFDKTETAELVKYASNSFLATKISFINELARFADKVNVNIKDVAYAMGLDNRIGPKFLQAGIGFGGSCFPKDVSALVSMFRKVKLEPKIIKDVLEINDSQVDWFLEKIEKNVKKGVITIWGLAFKPNSDDIRESRAIVLAKKLVDKGYIVNVYDPIAMENAKLKLKDTVNYYDDKYSALENSNALILATEWDEFREPDWNKVKQIMQDLNLFDGRNIYDPKTIKEIGFNYFGVGRR